ncbi:MAG: DnaJ C-terminal domain-containing protein [Chthoniobacterales bacterium]
MAEDHYGVLGLSRDSTQVQIRDAYRVLARRFHPDLNRGGDATERSQVLNAAYETLRDTARRRAYDRELDRASQGSAPKRGARIEHNIKEEVRLAIEDFLRGTIVNLTVKDPANADGAETYRVTIPAMTAPGSRLRVPRRGDEGFLELRLKPRLGFRFKLSGADLKTDLRISAQRAEHGGSETIERVTGGIIRLSIPKRVKRGEIVRVAGEGMPRPRGGRGDLLVRITYRPEVRVMRTR